MPEIGDVTGSVWGWNPREGLGICQFSVHTGILEKWLLTPEKEKARIDELAHEREGQQTGSLSFLLYPLCVFLTEDVVHLGWAFGVSQWGLPLQIFQPRKVTGAPGMWL